VVAFTPSKEGNNVLSNYRLGLLTALLAYNYEQYTLPNVTVGGPTLSLAYVSIELEHRILDTTHSDTITSIITNIRSSD